MTTVAIPLTTLTVGTHVFGPISVAAGTRDLSLLLDRTVGTSSLNSLSVTSTIDMTWDFSLDNGVTWQTLFSAHTIGGSFLEDEPSNPNFGNPQNVTGIIARWPIALPAQWRATVTIGGPSSISVSGTTTVT